MHCKFYLGVLLMGFPKAVNRIREFCHSNWVTCTRLEVRIAPTVFFMTCDTTIKTNSCVVIFGDCSINLNIHLLLRSTNLVEDLPRGRECPQARKAEFLTTLYALDFAHSSFSAIVLYGIPKALASIIRFLAPGDRFAKGGRGVPGVRGMVEG